MMMMMCWCSKCEMVVEDWVWWWWWWCADVASVRWLLKTGFVWAVAASVIAVNASGNAATPLLLRWFFNSSPIIIVIFYYGRTKYSICIPFGQNSRPNSVFIFGRIMMQKVDWIGIVVASTYVFCTHTDNYICDAERECISSITTLMTSSFVIVALSMSIVLHCESSAGGQRVKFIFYKEMNSTSLDAFYCYIYYCYYSHLSTAKPVCRQCFHCCVLATRTLC